MSRVLHIDLETYSDIDIGKCGAYRYVDSPNFEILLLAYAYDDEPVTVIDVAQREGWPTQVLDDILSSDITKVAHNAAFERICLSKFLNTHLDPKAWHCTMVHALSLGFPASLADVGKALNLEEDKQKMAVGKRLITYFCKPCKPTQANGQRTRNYPHHDPEKWDLFKEYNRQDVVTEQAIYERLVKFPLPESEQQLYCLDQSINDYGIGVDTDLMDKVIGYSMDYEAHMRKECEKLTGGINVHSIVQLKQWLTEQEGRQIDSLTKDDVDQLLKLDLKPESKRILELRQETGKTSVKKYEAFERSICSDGRIRGAFQFYGAGRTGRWAGRLIQPQNFPRNAFEDIALARQMVKSEQWDEIEMLYGSMNDVFSTLIRTLVVPPQGMTFAIADYSAIEARVVAWMADEKWRQDVFANGGDIYCMSATQMFGVPVEKHGQNSHLRKKGKVAELACISEYEPVLTDQGWVPIKYITKKMLVWDGTEFVKHDGLVYRGIKGVITYDGVTATPDHLVYVERKHNAIHFGESAKSGSHLLEAGNGWDGLRSSGNHQPREKMDKGMAQTLCTRKVSGLWGYKMGKLRKSPKRFVKGLSALYTGKACSSVAVQKVYGSKTKMHKSKGRKLQKLWGKRNRISLQKYQRSLPVYDGHLWLSRPEFRTRQDRRQRPLRARKSSMGYPSTKLYKSKKVYDILNCGERHTFTVRGYLVHNCGYGGGVGALRKMGGEQMGLTEKEMDDIVKKWRRSSPHVVKLWRELGDAAIEAIDTRLRVKCSHGVSFKYAKGILFMTLPSGRSLAYVQPRFDGRELTYMGMNQTTRKWERTKTWGGKLTENLIQAIARDCLAVSMSKIQKAGYHIVMHVHDEVIVEVPEDDAEGHLKRIEELMGEQIDWAPGLILTADGFTSEYYRKD